VRRSNQHRFRFVVALLIGGAVATTWQIRQAYAPFRARSEERIGRDVDRTDRDQNDYRTKEEAAPEPTEEQVEHARREFQVPEPTREPHAPTPVKELTPEEKAAQEKARAAQDKALELSALSSGTFSGGGRPRVVTEVPTKGTLRETASIIPFVIMPNSDKAFARMFGHEPTSDDNSQISSVRASFASDQAAFFSDETHGGDSLVAALSRLAETHETIALSPSAQA
jgi:hypothetical protein